jgi:hypothetical protein
MDVRGGRVDAELDAERATLAAALLQPIEELLPFDEVDDSSLEDAELFFGGQEFGHRHGLGARA